ncbi:MAG: ATP-binding protein [Pseudobdellovibrionaceae bacterium]
MIKLKSIAQVQKSYRTLEIELTLLPGIPGLQIVGGADALLKESAHRIRAAIKSAGFHWPKAQQILVNVSPSGVKKASSGLELAIVIAYLLESEQIPLVDLSQFVFYGELGLDGSVRVPEDLSHVPFNYQDILFTGKTQTLIEIESIQIEHLGQLNRTVHAKTERADLQPQRRSVFENWKFSPEQAEVLLFLALGKHSALLAGPSGTGKSTLAQALGDFLPLPDSESFFELKKIHREFNVSLTQVPLVKPHHSTPLMSMVGGGNIPAAGEISRAHGGLLILDEFLEFHPTVIEALREPMEEKRIRVARGKEVQTYPADMHFVATTNRCPCGRFVPGGKSHLNCRYSQKKCQSYKERLSGPMMDRFDVVFFQREFAKSELTVEGREISARISEIKAWRSDGELGSRAEDTTWLPQWNLSFRRQRALQKVARTLADLDQSQEVCQKHQQKALEWACLNFELLQKWDL